MCRIDRNAKRLLKQSNLDHLGRPALICAIHVPRERIRNKLRAYALKMYLCVGRVYPLISGHIPSEISRLNQQEGVDHHL